MDRSWFKRKAHGWGWHPATWQGWFIVLAYVALVVGNFYRIDSHSHSASDTLINFVPHTIVLTLLLIAVCYFTGEEPRWQRGSGEERDDD